MLPPQASSQFPVQVDQEVHAAMEHAALVDVEIHVHVQGLPVEVVVRSATEQRFVRDEIGNAGQLAHGLQEGRGVDVPVELRIEGADRRDVLEHGLAPGLADLVHGGTAAEGRELPQQPVRGIDFEETVDRDVAERLRLLECVLDIERVGQNPGTNHIKSNPTP